VLLTHLAFFVESLEALGSKLGNTTAQTRLFQERISRVKTLESVKLLGEAEQSTPSGTATGHSYIANVIEERGRLLMGHVDWQSQRQNVYECNRITGDGKAVAGGASTAAMEAFFR
jgi:hypothetical protein